MMDRGFLLRWTRFAVLAACAGIVVSCERDEFGETPRTSEWAFSSDHEDDRDPNAEDEPWASSQDFRASDSGSGFGGVFGAPGRNRSFGAPLGSSFLRGPDSERFRQRPWTVEPCEDCAEKELYPEQRVVCLLPEFGLQRACMPRQHAARLFASGSRYWLLRGDAELTTVDIDCDPDRPGGLYAPSCGVSTRRTLLRPGAADRPIDRAMEYWRYAVDWGRPFGAQAALLAQRRLQAHMVQCESDTESLERISRVGPGGVGDVISLRLRQRALRALGYYAEEIDGAYGPATREAARNFQRELGYDETGSLSPRQTTLLICHAAQTARDPQLQNALGIMYAAGLGVTQNTDLSLEWFETAARRNDPDAHFNLSIIYGTGAVLGSYRLCGLVENPERADAYLRDAAGLGHPMARRWRNNREFYRFDDASDRWVTIGHRLVEAAMERESEFFLDWRERIHLDDLRYVDPGCLQAELPAQR